MTYAINIETELIDFGILIICGCTILFDNYNGLIFN